MSYTTRLTPLTSLALCDPRGSSEPQRRPKALVRLPHGIFGQLPDYVLQTVLAHERDQVVAKEAVLGDSRRSTFGRLRLDHETGRVILVVQVGGQLCNDGVT